MRWQIKALAAAMAVSLVAPALAEDAAAPQVTSRPETSSTADHSQFAILQQSFATGSDVTKACLSCHNEAAHQVMDTLHWTWEYQHTDPLTGEEQVLGKKHVINAFCGNIETNEPRCTSCHAGYGWEDDSFDFTNQNAVDCLVCHDTTGTYAKYPTNAGHPLYEDLVAANGSVTKAPELSFVAQNVGQTGRENCGSCHFYGGGGDGVKHGDLDSSLVNPPVMLDVHMSPDGANLACQDCHVTEAHAVAGSRYDALAADTGGMGLPGERRDVASCQSCHGDTPHPATVVGFKLNDHTDKVACQSCHIPEMARGGVATKTLWDWSTAGRTDENGKPYTEIGENGHPVYMSIKGTFEYEENVVPEYRFSDGHVDYLLDSEQIDPSKAVAIAQYYGSYDDPASRIWPFKIMQGKQAYDTELLTLIKTHVFGKDDTALWTNLDWDKAIAAGMEGSGLPYSGHYDFVETTMWWPITHMVAPASEALDCVECHSRDGRLKALAGFYMPGRDSFWWLDWIAALATIAALGGVALHAFLRVFLGRRRISK